MARREAGSHPVLTPIRLPCYASTRGKFRRETNRQLGRSWIRRTQQRYGCAGCTPQMLDVPKTFRVLSVKRAVRVLSIAIRTLSYRHNEHGWPPSDSQLLLEQELTNVRQPDGVFVDSGAHPRCVCTEQEDCRTPPTRIVGEWRGTRPSSFECSVSPSIALMALLEAKRHCVQCGL